MPAKTGMHKHLKTLYFLLFGNDANRRFMTFYEIAYFKRFLRLTQRVQVVKGISREIWL